MNKIRRLIFSLVIMFSILIKSVFAASNPISKVMINLISLFDIDSILTGSMRIGFIKFLLWIMIFAIIDFTAKKVIFKDQEKPRIAFSLAFSLISVLFIPENSVLAIVSIYSNLFLVLLFVSILGIFTYLGLQVLKGECWKELMGFLVLLFNLMIISFMEMFINPVNNIIDLESSILAIFSAIISWLNLVAVILLIYKLFKLISCMFREGGSTIDRCG